MVLNGRMGVVGVIDVIIVVCVNDFFADVGGVCVISVVVVTAVTPVGFAVSLPIRLVKEVAKVILLVLVLFSLLFLFSSHFFII